MNDSHRCNLKTETYYLFLATYIYVKTTAVLGKHKFLILLSNVHRNVYLLFFLRRSKNVVLG